MSQSNLKFARLRLPVFAVTIFLGAFLLFFVQPLIGKYILPWFGGAPNVWTTCLLFFQFLLLMGYAYAHLINRYFPLRKQIIIHGILLLLAAITLPITPSEHLKPAGNENPTVQILIVLTESVGLPYLVLSATSPLVQAWFSDTHQGRSPYGLYALSNAGSLLALLGFPFIVEPWTTRTIQINCWSLGMVLFALICGYLAWSLRSVSSLNKKQTTEVGTRLKENGSRLQKFVVIAFWFALPACGTAILMSTTNKLCQDMVVVPFLWILPLSLYLVTFIICFHGQRWYIREIYLSLLIVFWAGVLWVQFFDLHIVFQIFIFCGALFLSCMICHGELYMLRPEPARLTKYYLSISAGSALGGFFVTLLAPILFDGYWEYPISLWTVGLLMLIALCTDDLTSRFYRSINLNSSLVSFAIYPGRFMVTLSAIITVQVLIVLVSLWFMEKMVGLTIGYNISEWLKSIDFPGEQTIRLLLVSLIGTIPLNFIFWFKRHKKYWRLSWINCLLVPSLGILGVGLFIHSIKTQQNALHSDRNFYGSLTTTRYFDNSEEPYLALNSGRIIHGSQYEAFEISDRTTTYYTEKSGLGLALKHDQTVGKHVGAVGLGVGTVAAYAKNSDKYRFYDINPQVMNLSIENNSQFTFLINAKNRGAQVKTVLGDARLSMEQELFKGEKQNFDLLVLDAFISDYIPVHLLTKESMHLYMKHLKPEGVIAIHISNQYLDLESVVRRLAKEIKIKMVVVDSHNDINLGDDWIYPCTWVLLSKNDEFIDKIEDYGYPRTELKSIEESPLWTDDYTSIFRIIYKPMWWNRWFQAETPNKISGLKPKPLTGSK